MQSVTKVFSQLHLSEKSAVSLEQVEADFVLDIAAQNTGTNSTATSSQLLAATTSNYGIRIFSRENLASTGTIAGHENVITDVCFGHSQPDLLYSSSLDKTIKCWDLRSGLGKAVQTFEGYDETNNLFTSMCVNCSDIVLCAGTEAKGEDVYLLFWDRRQGELMGCYKESHQDDITQVLFHPDMSDRLATGSTDGLVCVFDISQTCEDDALLSILNAESSVGKIGWCGENSANIYSITCDDILRVWDTTEADCICEHLTLKEEAKVDYLVDCLSNPCSEDLFVLAGLHSGDLKIVNIGGEEVGVVCSLSGGHSAVVRCSHWDSQSETLVTGGEDSLLCLWSAAQGNKPSIPHEKGKLKNRRSVGKKKQQPY